MSGDLSHDIEKLRQLENSLESTALEQGASAAVDAVAEGAEIETVSVTTVEDRSASVPLSPALDDDVYETDIAQPPSEHDESRMTVVEHLGELRTRILRSLLVFVVAFLVAFAYGKQILLWLKVPAGNIPLQALSIEEPLMVFCKVSLYGALVLSLPWLLFEASGFIAPGLRRSERKILAPIVVGGPILFIGGTLFAYYLVLPPMLSFFSSFGTDVAPVQQRLDFYISLVTTMLFYMGLCFQLPVVLFALSLAGLVNSGMLVKLWRHALLAFSVAAAIITPDPTIFSMLIVLGGLIGLYFGTILLLKLFGR
ncbi:MAG: twin-arginine translocase subunit TatC [Candidatus Obscuribacterales bacterium]|nr:twin-arginine translocase subunit TatC [Candidatus Obscuribacterales bacterium]